MARPGRHGWPVSFGPQSGLYGAEDFINRYGPLTSTTHGQTPWRGLTTATDAGFRPASLLGRLGLGIGSLGAGLATHSDPVGVGSDLTGMDPGYMLGPIVDPTFEPTAPFHFRDVLGHYEKGAVPGHLPMDITETPFYSAARGEPYAYSTEGLVTPEVDEVTPELDENTRALIDFDMEQNRRSMGLPPAPFGSSPALQGLSTYSPAFASATPTATSSFRGAPIGGFGRGMGRNVPAGSQDFPAISMANVLGNVEANRRGEMVDPTWSGPFTTTAGSVGALAALRGLVSDANARDFADSVTGPMQASPGAELAAQEAMASMGLSPTPVGSSRGHHPGQGDLEAALANTGNLMSPGQYAQQHFDKTDTMANQIMSGVISGLRGTSGTRTTEQQRIDAFKSALNNQRALAEDTDATAAIAAQIAAQDAAVAAYGEDQAGQNTYGQTSTGWAPGKALTTMDVLGNVVDVTLENDPVSVAIANARKSALANPDITVAATVAEQVAQTEATVNAMGLTGAAAAAAAAQINANQGYVTADEYAGFKEAQQAQDAEVAAASAAAAAASAASSGGYWGGEDTGVSTSPGGAPAGAQHARSDVSKAVSKAVSKSKAKAKAKSKARAAVEARSKAAAAWGRAAHGISSSESAGDAGYGGHAEGEFGGTTW